MKKQDILMIFNNKSEVEKTTILLRALEIKDRHRSAEDSIVLSMGYYADINNKGEWTK